MSEKKNDAETVKIEMAEGIMLAQTAFNLVACHYEKHSRYDLPEEMVKNAEKYLNNLLVKALENLSLVQ